MVLEFRDEIPKEIINNLASIEADIIAELREINEEVDDILLKHFNKEFNEIIQVVKKHIERNSRLDLIQLIRKLGKRMLDELNTLLHR